jgi:hypothetical protein
MILGKCGEQMIQTNECSVLRRNILAVYMKRASTLRLGFYIQKHSRFAKTDLDVCFEKATEKIPRKRL